MKKSFVLFVVLFSAFIARSQGYNYLWSTELFDSILPNGVLVSSLGDPANALIETPEGIAEDYNGNTITAGSFGGAYFDLAPLTNVYDPDGGIIFIQKRNAAGNELWSKYIDGGDNQVFAGSRNCQDVAVDAQGNIFICGFVNDTTDFDPGVGEALIFPQSVFTGYIAKYDAAGNFMFVYPLEGGTDAAPRSLVVGPNNDIYVTGVYEGTLDFDGGVGSQLESSIGGIDDNFLLKIDNSGQYVWHKVWGGQQTDDPVEVQLDDSNNIYVACQFHDSLDVDPGPAVHMLIAGNGGTANNSYISKFDNAGNWLWSTLFKSGSCHIRSMDVNETGVAVLGSFGSNLEIEQTGANVIIPINTPGYSNVFAAKLDLQGQYLWHYYPEPLQSSTYTSGTEIFSKDDDYFLLCSVLGATDLDNGPGVDAVGNPTAIKYLVNLSGNGNYQWNKPFELSAYGTNNLHEIESKGDHLYVMGYYSDGEFDANPDPGQDAIHEHWFEYTTVLVKLSGCSTQSNVQLTGCLSYISPSGNYTWTTSGMYTDTLQNMYGCDSVLMIDLTISGPETSQVQENACLSYTSPSGNYTWTTSGMYTDTLQSMYGCDSVLMIDLTINGPETVQVQENVCSSYTSPSGNYTWTTSGLYTDTLQNMHGCDSVLMIDLTINGPGPVQMQENACNSFTSPSGLYTWNSTGIYSDTLSAANGCDSILVIDLTITNVDVSTSIAGNGTMIQADNGGQTYQWIDCNTNQPISGETNQSFTPTIAGEYAVIVTEGGCSDTSACVSSTVGISELSDLPIRVFPNPATDVLTVEWEEEPLNAQLFDAQGRRVSVEYVETKPNILQMDVSKLESGMYVLSLSTPEIAVSIRVIIN